MSIAARKTFEPSGFLPKSWSSAIWIHKWDFSKRKSRLLIKKGNQTFSKPHDLSIIDKCRGIALFFKNNNNNEQDADAQKSRN